MPGMPPSVGADLPFVSLLLAPSGCRSLLGWPRHEPCQLVPLGLPSSFVTSNTAPGTQPESPLSPCQPWVPALPPSHWEGTAASLGTPGTAAAASLGPVPVSVPSLAAPPAAAEGLGRAVLGRGRLMCAPGNLETFPALSPRAVCANPLPGIWGSCRDTAMGGGG